jgi:hypothetical protein
MWYKSEPSDSPFFSHYPPIFNISVGKNDVNNGLPLAKVTTNGIKYMAKFASILGPLVGFGRGASLPYFGKQSDI